MSNSKLADAALRAARPNNPALNQALVQAVDACAAAEQAIDERSADAERLTDEACDALTHAAALLRQRRGAS